MGRPRCGARRSKSLKNKVRKLRGERGWGQGELAERLDISRQSVNDSETGKFDPSLIHAFALARLFCLRIEDAFLDHI